VLNNVGGSRHEAKLTRALEHYTDIPVLGALQQDAQLAITEGHLGLTPGNDAGDTAPLLQALGSAVERQVDVPRLLAAVATLPASSNVLAREAAGGARAADVRIGIAEDRAFGFYYADDLDALRAAGARLVRFDTLNDPQLPNVDALFLGGGFPERHAAALEANASLRARIRGAIEAGMPVYAECGGLMYLARTLRTDGHAYRMVGAIPGDVVMRERPVGRGYVRVAETAAFPWGGGSGGEIPAHEFHYAAVENLGSEVRFAYDVRRGFGVDGARDGIVVHNVLAAFAHLRSIRRNPWAARFVEFVRGSEYRRRREANVVYLPPTRARELLGCRHA
jgi:cobyrinic acid a,c-diamide synthase